jgi:hypothetical protein
MDNVDNTDSVKNEVMVKDSSNTIMMRDMQCQDNSMMYTFDVLVVVGLAIIIVQLAKILKARRR